MKTFSASEAKDNIDSVLETALLEPVKIFTERSALVVLNAAEYDRLNDLSRLEPVQGMVQTCAHGNNDSSAAKTPAPQHETETGGCETPEELDRLMGKVDSATA